MFEIADVDALGRIGKLIVKDKQMITPNLFPVIHPSRNVVSSHDLKKIGAQCVFTNAYIIYQNQDLREKVLKEGVHKHLGFDGLIATDSGAFQQYMYNNNKIDIRAAEIEQFQENIGSDFPVILDLPVQLDDNYEDAKEKVLVTISRAKDNIKRRTNLDNCWFGPIHGARYSDLLKLSATEMSKLDFGVYAIGGLVKAFLNYRFDLTLQMLLTVKQNIIPNIPIHMFGLGLPQFFSLAVACGCDLMDSAAYVLYAKENRYFTLSTGTEKLEALEEFPCHCPICCDNKPKELLKLEPNLKTELLAKHNLYLSFSELRTVRQAIREGNLWELVEQRMRAHPTLVNAVNVVKKNIAFIEKHEKLYKPRGRLYTSTFDIFRPLIKRHENRIKANYRVPKNVKFLLILPELDTTGKNSPSIIEWLNRIENNTTIQRNLIHVVFFSSFYGLIPLELSDTYPLSQHESIVSTEESDLLYKNSIQKAKTFLSNNIKYYERCGILIPERYKNQFGEYTSFSKENPIYELLNEIKGKYVIEGSKFSDIDEIIHFFKNDT